MKEDIKKIGGDSMKTINDTLTAITDIEKATHGDITAGVKVVAVDIPEEIADVLGVVEDGVHFMHDVLPTKKHEECHYYDTAEECEEKIIKENNK